MNQESKLSIIVTAYNAEEYLARCLKSIIRQSYQDCEIIVVNDGSNDSTQQIVDSFLKQDYRIISRRLEKNEGLFAARLTGVKTATGNYIAFVDSDDYVSVDYYRPMMELIAKDNLDIVANDTVRVMEDGTKLEMPWHARSLGDELLKGEQVRQAYFLQEGFCYCWHTIWNKIYSSELWRKAMPFFDKMSAHVVMTEDIAFSSVLFYFAQSFIHISDGAYFYCVQPSASTNVNVYQYEKYKKNIVDLSASLNFVSNFLEGEGAEQLIRDSFDNFKKRYCRMYRDTLNDMKVSRAKYQECADILAGIDSTSAKYQASSFSSDQILSTWYGNVEEIKEKILSADTSVISFDIFDTLLLRPLWSPSDLFKLVESEAHPPSGASMLRFKQLRVSAETLARDKYSAYGIEDITIDDIYDTLQEISCFTKADCEDLKKCEINLEKKLLYPRKTGLSLFKLAKFTGKKVILVSDMYLPCSVIREILSGCDIDGYSELFVSSDCKLLKSTKSLFGYVAKKIATDPDKILHIGDNWNVDVLCAKACGYKTAFLPQTKDRYNNQVPGMPTNRCATLSCIVGNHLTTWDALFSSLGFRTMQSLVANKLFDNPYCSWNAKTDLNSDAYIAGYHSGGMYLTAISSWLVKLCRKYGLRRICFLTRDGYLPMKAFTLLQSYLGAEDITVSYVPCSRQALMPIMVATKQNLFNMPVAWGAHTPKSLYNKLEFCLNDFSEKTKKEIEKAGFPWNERFESEEKYYQFLKFISEMFFSCEKSEKKYEEVKDYYYKAIPSGSLVFDLGYSGRIIRALNQCCKDVVYAYALHDNEQIFDNAVRQEQIKVEFLSRNTTSYSNLIREFFVSDLDNACAEIVNKNGVLQSRIEPSHLSYQQKFAKMSFEKGSLKFVSDFVTFFSNLKNNMIDDEAIMTLPFEGLIHVVSNEDRKMLRGAYSDDALFGNNECIEMAAFWMSQTDRNIVSGREFQTFGSSENDFVIRRLMAGKGKTSKLLICILLDRKILKEYGKKKLFTHPRMEYIARKWYHAMRKVYRKLKY